MRRFIVGTVMAAVVGGFMAFQYVAPRAGDYHAGASLVCSDCHTMHYSEGGAQPALADAGGPFDKLLLKTSTNNLCLACHDADGGGTAPDLAPDVMTTASANQATYRAAGAFRAAVASASASAHDLGVAAAVTAPGGTWQTSAVTGMTCADCHEPHGTANYRNLQLRPGGFATDINVTDVSQTALTPTTTQYAVTNIAYGADANGNPDMSNWCAGCHKNFGLAVANQSSATFNNDANLGGDEVGDNAPDPWHRHPNSHVTMGEGNTNGHASYLYFNTGVSSRVPVASNGGTVPNADNVPFCGSCHKAHGADKDRTVASPSQGANLIWDDPTTATIQDGTATQQTCNTCHKKF